MSGNNDLVTKLKGTSTLERATFGPGMLLRHDDLEQLNVYPRELSRLLVRSLFGCGVVCGLVVKVEEKCDKVWVTVSSGLALDCSGDPIHVPKKTDPPLSFDPDKCNDDELWVILCGTKRACAPRTSACASDDEESSPVPSREKDGYEISIVRELPKCICACLKEQATDPATQATPAGTTERESRCACVDPEHPCYVDHYNGVCGCDEGNDCNCCCDYVVLARLKKLPDHPWTVSHEVRRFVRPVLMRDPEVARERREAATKKTEQDQAAQKAAAEMVAAVKAAVEKAAADKAAAELDAQRLQQLAKQAEAPVARERARSSRSRSSK